MERNSPSVRVTTSDGLHLFANPEPLTCKAIYSPAKILASLIDQKNDVLYSKLIRSRIEAGAFAALG